MSHCSVPNWNLRQEHAEDEENWITRSSHVQNHQSPNCVVPMPVHEVPDLAWENGLQSMHGLGAISFPSPTTNPTWDKNGDHALESVLHQATCHKPNSPQRHHDVANGSSQKWGDRADHTRMDSGSLKKRTRSDSDKCERYFYGGNIPEELLDTSMTSWPSSESLRSVKTKTTTDDNCAHHEGLENKNEENQTEGEASRSLLTRNSRAAAVHNQSERRRRDKINQRLKALQKLVPNASKTDKASMLDEIIKYMKQLQTQVQVMSVSSIPQMGMALGMQQQIQMSILARMGMGVGLGMGMGMLNMNNIARSAQHQALPSFLHPGGMTGAMPTMVPPPFFMPPTVLARPTRQSITGGATPNNSMPYNDPYSAFLAHQSVNMDLYNKMAALFRHQAYTSQQTSDNSPQANHVQPQ